MKRRGLVLFSEFPVGFEQVQRAGDHVAEGAQRFVGEPAFDDFEDSGNFLATGEGFFFGKFVIDFGFGDAGEF